MGFERFENAQNLSLSRDEDFGQKVREYEMASKCTKISVSCICYAWIMRHDKSSS